MAFFAADISALSMKVVESKYKDDGFEILSFGEAKMNVNLDDSKQNLAMAAKAFNQLVVDSKIRARDVYLNVSESDVYTRVIQLPRLSEKELENAIKYEAEQYIPVPLTEVYLEYEILYSPPPELIEAKMEILLIAANKKRVERLVAVAQMAGFTPLVVETSLISALRSVRSQIRDNALLIDIGQVSTDIIILQNGQVRQTSSLKTGGVALTRAIAQNLSLSEQQAKAYKHSYGLDESQLEGKIALAMKQPIEAIVAHIVKNINYMKSLNSQAVIDQLLVSGGTALMPNLSYYLVNKLNLEVNLANPLQDCKNKNLPQALLSQAPRFCSVIGLSIREK